MKMKIKHAVAAAIALGFALSAASANATIATITYTGTVSPPLESGFDALGLFGPVNSSLSGDYLKLVYTLDTSLGVPAPCGPMCVAIIGGDGFPAPGISIPLTANLTINGKTVEFDGSYFSADEIAQNTSCSGVSCSFFEQNIYDDNGADTRVVTNAQSTNPTQFPLSLTSPFNLNLDNPATIGIIGGGEFAVTTGVGETYAGFSLDQVTVAVLGVPEPATWAMMLVGFGGLGVALRCVRRRFGAATN